MIRTSAALALVLALTASAWAQLIVRPPPGRPQPAGVIQPPVVPFVGSNAVPSPTPLARVAPRPFLMANPFYNVWGYAPLWPAYYDYPAPVEPAYLPVPVRTEVTVVTAPPQPVAPAPLRARLTLNVPANAEVWLAGQAVDVAAVPVVIESPDLEPGQRYNFDIRVAWKEPSGVQERKRTVTVEGGRSTSLTYASANGASGGR
jgi:uncharacterized protein (TIGR03000 family)